ncbi:YaaL family protein [Neobacillus novalis]|uniref:YaaL family protein n=1 Tax=Neobacillus novalis TaxID=220687 RepID=UPI003F768145
MRAGAKYKQEEEPEEWMMFFRRTGRLRKEYDEKLLAQLNQFKQHWQQEKSLLEISFDPSEEVICQTKVAEAKYIFLLREAKQRKVTFYRA